MDAENPERLPGGRRETVKIFRSRLAEALDRAGMNRAALARATGVDRSTLSQLLSPANDRLPRADTVAAIAFALRVSLDWLLGLSQEDKLGADVLQESLKFTPSARTPVDENLARWHDEAVGYKIRYVPATLPDLVKTEEVLHHEFQDYVGKTVDQAIAVTHGRRASRWRRSRGGRGAGPASSSPRESSSSSGWRACARSCIPPCGCIFSMP
jgi:transcriptional regulator with XRE-family HTH domain